MIQAGVDINVQVLAFFLIKQWEKLKVVKVLLNKKNIFLLFVQPIPKWLYS